MARIDWTDRSEILEDPYYLGIEHRLNRISLYLGAGIVLAGLLLASVKFAYSFVIGGCISYLNFSWMKQGVDRMLRVEGVGERSRGHSNRMVLFKYFVRYALIGGTLYAIFRFRIFDPWGAALGLFLFVLAVIYECIYQVIKTLIENRTHGRA